MKKTTLLILSGTFAISAGYAQNIYTTAGNGVLGYSGDNMAATAAELGIAEGLAVDDSGNVYIADLDYNRIREVSALTGRITTVAGNGIAGYSGDGGAAVTSEINEPTGVAIDSSFNIYISDYQNNRVRKVDKITGIITTIAGNGTNGYTGDGIPATDAEMAYNEGVGVDDSGNVYIADTYNYRIRKVTRVTGIITTVVGNGVMGFSGDGGQAVTAEIGHMEKVTPDKNGNIYFSDENNCRIRYVNKSSGIITTICGTGTVGYYGVGGPATDAELNYPEGLALDPTGSFLYFVDLYDAHALKLDISSGILTLYAGTAAGGYTGDGGPASAAGLTDPTDIAVDKWGNVFIADQGDYRIRGIKFGVEAVPSINDGQEIGVYPVPNTGSMMVQLPGTGYRSLKVYDAMGKEVYTQLIEPTLQDKSFELNLGIIPTGIYFIQVQTAEKAFTKRIVIER